MHAPTKKNIEISIRKSEIRPSFIPKDVFRDYLTSSGLNKHLTVNGMLASSYVSKVEKTKRPIKSTIHNGVKKWRIIDVVARAKADCLDIGPSRIYSLKSDIAYLEQKKADLEKEIGSTKHQLEVDTISKALSGATLLSEREIVDGAILDLECTGVYFLIKNHKIVYVGQAMNVFRRVADHSITKEFDSFSYIRCKQEVLNVVESLYIHVFKPPLNGRLPNGRGIYAPLRLDELLLSKDAP